MKLLRSKTWGSTPYLVRSSTVGSILWSRGKPPSRLSRAHFTPFLDEGRNRSRVSETKLNVMVPNVGRFGVKLEGSGKVRVFAIGNPVWRFCVRLMSVLRRHWRDVRSVAALKSVKRRRFLPLLFRSEGCYLLSSCGSVKGTARCSVQSSRTPGLWWPWYRSVFRTELKEISLASSVTLFTSASRLLRFLAFLRTNTSYFSAVALPSAAKVRQQWLLFHLQCLYRSRRSRRLLSRFLVSRCCWVTMCLPVNCLRLYLCTMPPVPMLLLPMPSLLLGLPLSVG